MTVTGRYCRLVQAIWQSNAAWLQERVAGAVRRPVQPTTSPTVEPGPFGSANQCGESADTDLACQQDG
jgi:hypothetical protein